jgi:N-acetyl-anhydromuramyl-L-alanine amidase AmpD
MPSHLSRARIRAGIPGAFLAVAFAVLAALGTAQAADDPGCEATGRCRALMGVDRQDRPNLASLVEDVLQIMDAPEERWVKTEDRPPPTVTLGVADLLRECFHKAVALRRFLLPDCTGKNGRYDAQVVKAMVPWPEERERLMQDYLQEHTSDSSTRLEDPTVVVTHWTGENSLKSSMATFAKTRIDSVRGTVAKNGAVNVSCHFVVDRDGTIYQLLPEDKVARHAIGLNKTAFCIENVGGADVGSGSRMALTEAQVKANSQLIQYLAWKHPKLAAVIGHFEYKSFEKTYLFRENFANYRTGKDDPGPKFMDRLRRDLDEQGSCAAGRR